MNFTKETQGTYSYLVYEIKDEETIDEFSLGMLSNNNIPGVLSVIFTQMDDEKYFKYNISSKVSASEFFAGTVTKKRLLGVFESLAEAFISADEYMINENSLLLDLDYIYADVSTCKAELVYLPIISTNESKKSINMFLKEIMFSTQFEQSENCDYVAQIINYLNSSTAFNIYEFKKLINGLKLGESKKENFVVEKPIQQKQNDEKKVSVVENVIQDIQREEIKVVRQQEGTKPIQSEHPIVKPEKSPVEQVKKEKQMSMFNLLMHYSKENKELYKSQKQEKEPKIEKNKEDTTNKKSKNKKNKSQKQQPTFSVPCSEFVVPGMESSMKQGVSPIAAMQAEKIKESENANSTVPKENISERVTTIQPRSEIAGVSANFGETTVLGVGMASGETTVLSVAQATKQQAIPHLIRLRNNEKIPINKPRYRIGKEKSYVDYFIGDNTTISRSHADIINNDGVCEIVDMNSTNHTYVNNEMIQSGMEVELKQGDKIRLANEEFEFRLY